MTQPTLHGRPLNVGDKVWDIEMCEWITVENYIHVDKITRRLSYFCYSWNEIDLSKIEPPLCWVEGHPVNPGTPMFYRADDGELYACVVLGIPADSLVSCKNNHNTTFNIPIERLTFEIPKTKKVWAAYSPGIAAISLCKTKELAQHGAWRLTDKIVQIEVPVYFQVFGDGL